MGIVNEDGIILAGGGHNLHPALYALCSLQGANCLLQRNPQCNGRPQYPQGIVHRELSGNPKPNMGAVLPVFGSELHVVGMEHRVFSPQVILLLFAIGHGPAGGGFENLLRSCVVAVEYADVAAPEQDGLGFPVFLHGLVEIQMILGQVGEYAHLEVNARHPVQHQGMGRNLHHHMGAARLLHLIKQLLQLKGFRGGALGFDDLVADHILNGTDQAHLGVQRLLQHGFQEIGAGGLAVGAGDAHKGHIVRRVAEEIGGRKGHGIPGILHQHIGNVALRLPLTQHRRRALFHRHGDELMAVGGIARHRHEQIAGLHVPGIIADTGDLQSILCMAFRNRDACQNFFEFHFRPLLIF